MALKFKLSFFLVLAAIEFTFAVSDKAWNEYKIKYNKTYNTSEDEASAKSNYDKSLFSIKIHNAAYEKRFISYKLSINQFSDMSFNHFRSMFPMVKFPSGNCNPTNNFSFDHTMPVEFDYTKRGYRGKIHNQGLKCNGGWAYSAAAALEIFRARIYSAEVKGVSAQQFLECIGNLYGCSNETSYTAFSYLRDSKNSIYDEIDYPNTPWTINANCLAPISNESYALLSFDYLCGVKTSLIMHIIEKISPIVIDFTPLSFEFLHYSGGIFTPPDNSFLGSHYMSVVGFSNKSKENRYWKIQNSFGENWGENGYIRLSFDASSILLQQILFPTGFAKILI